MQRLNRGMLGRYEIPERFPDAVTAVQFGLDELLLGVVDRLLEGVGVAALTGGEVPAEGRSPAELLREQDGMYTLLIRGYKGEQALREERVIQSILRMTDDAEALAREPDLCLGLLNAEAPDAVDQLSRAAALLEARSRAELVGLTIVCLGDSADCAEQARAALADRLSPQAASWLDGACAFVPALAEGFAARADAHEAAKQCAEMNYADGMLHLAEPFARLTLPLSVPRAEALGLSGLEGVRLVDDLVPALAQKHRLFDAGLFAMAAPGWLLGCDTLSDCMKHERLRAFVGRAFYDELLPQDAESRKREAPYVIECFERFENPLNRNGLLPRAHHLLDRLARGALPLMRAWADERYEPPRCLSFALAATIMLYAGARPNAAGQYEVARGSQRQILIDDPDVLRVFSALSHDMDPSALAYAALADRELWQGMDLREIEGLEARVALDIAHMQRDPSWLPED